jgi:hypothetical protein
MASARLAYGAALSRAYRRLGERYQVSSAPVAIMVRPSRQAAVSNIYALPALSADIRSCREEVRLVKGQQINSCLLVRHAVGESELPIVLDGGQRQIWSQQTPWEQGSTGAKHHRDDSQQDLVEELCISELAPLVLRSRPARNSGHPRPLPSVHARAGHHRQQRAGQCRRNLNTDPGVLVP